MILRPCPFCHKDIPRSISVCPYCHRDEQGKSVTIDPVAERVLLSDHEWQAILKELLSDDPFLRDQTADRISQHGRGIVQPLMAVLSDFSKPNLSGVARALGTIGDDRAIPVLAQATKVGDEDLRMASVRALARFNNPEVLPYLLSEAERPHPIIQSFLAHVLGSFHDARVVPVLSRLADHPNREVAFQAAYALGETGGKDSIHSLKALWRKKDVLLRAASSASLRRLGAKPSYISTAMLVWGFLLLSLAGAGAGYFFYR